MTSAISAQRDERTVAVENASFRLAYLVLSFGLLVLAILRSVLYKENAWDLLLLVILGGGIAAIYQMVHRVIMSRWVVLTVTAMVLAALLAGILVILR